MNNVLDVRSNLLPNLKKLYNILLYVSVITAIVALVVYATKGKTQYNSQTLTPVIIVSLIVAIALNFISVIFDIRFLKYGASVAMLMAFLQFVITEINFFSNWIIATDPVSDDMKIQYVLLAVFLLVATVLAFVSAIMCKKAYYKKEEATNETL